MKKQVLALLRVSTVGQADEDRDGIPAQRQDIARWCKEHECEVVETFELTGISGSYVARSPEFQRMLKRLEEPKIDGVVFARMDRFFRPELLSSYNIFETFERTGKLMVCELGALRQSRSQDRNQIQMWGIIAGAEKENIKRRMGSGKNASRRDPTKRTDSLPFFVGFTPDQPGGNVGTFFYQDESKITHAVQRFLGGETLKTIHEDLGYRSNRALRIALENPWLYGYKSARHERDYGQRENPNAVIQRRTDEHGRLKDAKRRIPRREPIFTRTNLADTPLITKPVFDKVQARLGSNTKTWSQRRSLQSEKFLGTGLLHCACGEKMYGKADNRPGKPDYYLCATRFNKRTSCGNPSLNADDVDHEILFSLMGYFSDPKVVARQIEQEQNRRAPALVESQLASIEKDLSKIEAKLQRAVDLALVSNRFVAKVTELERDMAAKKAQRDGLIVDRNSKLTPTQIKRKANSLRDLASKFISLSMENRKSVLRQCVTKIDVDDEGRARLYVPLLEMDVPILPSPASERDAEKKLDEYEAPILAKKGIVVLR